MAMKRSTNLQPRHSEADKAVHFMSPTFYQTIPVKVKKVSALRGAIVRRTPPKLRTARKAKPSKSKKSEANGPSKPSKPKAGAGRNVVVQSAGIAAASAAEPSRCNKINKCPKCFITQGCSWVTGSGKMSCVDPKQEHWGVDTATSELHCNFFIELQKLTPTDELRVNKKMVHHITGQFTEEELANGGLIPGGHMDKFFRQKLESLQKSGKMTSDEQEKGPYLTMYKEVTYVYAENKETRKAIHTTWNDVFDLYNIKRMCQIAGSYVKEAVGTRVVPNSYDGTPVCMRIASTGWNPEAAALKGYWWRGGSCYPIKTEDIDSKAVAGTPC